MNAVDVVVFERAIAMLREFDMAFVLKDYSQTPIRICTIPSEAMPNIKRWLAELQLPWYSVNLNMNWATVMKELNRDVDGFLESGGWDGWFGEGGPADAGVEDAQEESDDGDDYVDSVDEDDDEEDSDDEPAEESSDASEGDEDEDSDEDDGMDWDELEEEAERADRKRDAEKISKGKEPTRQSKRARR
eukprot:TRINITY_DN8989_c2_g1_i1.p1 TRINITY_DN8989_c2_g1~~TRINITY_DN8989_c2_g1_i1.p1  ORF type:complete len:189 (-),score=54.40 TRINITY_DN8989_c2_g1_i1:205-771(-)